MSKTKQQVLAEATTIKNETVGGANTADRVGTAIYDVADNYVHSSDMPNMSNYQTTAAAAQETQRVNTALADKATTAALNSLTSTVSGKASATDVATLHDIIQKTAITYTDIIDVRADYGQDSHVVLSTPGAVQVDERFIDPIYRKHFWIDCTADMTVHFSGGNKTFEKNKSYHLFIMLDDNNVLHEYLIECL